MTEQKLENIFRRIFRGEVERKEISHFQDVSYYDELNNARQKFGDILENTTICPTLVDWFHSVKIVQE